MKTKLSELTYAYLQSVGLSRAHIHTDCSDGLQQFSTKDSFDLAKASLMAAYGDVNLIIDPAADWFDQISIDDEKWRADHEAFCREKAAWLKGFCCD